MLLYCTTTKVALSIHDEWLAWMQEVYLPQLLESGFFQAYTLAKLLGYDESDGPTYSLQLVVKDQKSFDIYHQTLAPKDEALQKARFGQEALRFSTLLSVVSKG
ncbi:MAG: DUF4286 family protein [Lewinella sp.]|nr:DUF4286 family protein [Lewinella sp.]